MSEALLRETFRHLPGIGPGTERRLRAEGLRDWTALRRALPERFRGERRDRLAAALDESERRLEARDWRWFAAALPSDARWRLLPGNLERVAYLDIESTGSGMPPLARSTTITFYFRGQIFQEHEPARKRELIRAIEREAGFLATFFGEGFDLPFLRREFGASLDHPHLDLCFWLKRHGYRGGLKRVQREFPEIPVRDSLDIDGFDAVRLWRLHERGVPRALDTLLAYNAEDTVVLEPLLVLALNRELAERARAEAETFSPLPLPAWPRISTAVCPRVYAMLRESAAEPHSFASA